MQDLIWLIPALPLAGFALLVFAGRRLGEPLAGWIATAAVGGSFLATVGVFASLVGRSHDERAFTQTVFEWLPVGGLHVDMGFLADPLSVTMCLFVTGIATLIHLYAIGYMHGDPRFTKFFVYLNLFVFSMLMLVLGDNLLVTFLGWEGVGACSYFLISFWHESEANASAGKKAFVTNRIGDFGFMMAMLFTFQALGTDLNYDGIVAASPSLATTTATAIAVALFVGACGKSAQLPLFVWLPDAMAGPTPVSALIHAATMVTAGVYLMTRMNPLIVEAATWVPTLIAVVGATTALFAATIAVAQNDIKKVLAYSTVSQLGYMFLAVGSGAYVAAIFHMVTHAFFKALLFLGSGSVIHGMHGEQDMRRMGGLRKVMPITGGTFIIGWLAIAGVRRSPASGPRTRSSCSPGRRARSCGPSASSPRAHRLLHEPPGVHGVLRRGPLGARGRGRPRGPRRRPGRGDPPPRVAVAHDAAVGGARRAGGVRWRAQPARARRHQVPGALAGAGDPLR
jgi:NADH-quinone oxidoreductase subunit L